MSHYCATPVQMVLVQIWSWLVFLLANVNAQWTSFSWNGYQYQFSTRDVSSYDQAQQGCSALGSSLATMFSNENETSFLFESISSLPHRSPFWIAVTTGSTGNWTAYDFYDGSTSIDDVSSLCHNRIPPLKHHCLIAYVDHDGNEKCSGVSCSLSAPKASKFICKRKLAAVATTNMYELDQSAVTTLEPTVVTTLPNERGGSLSIAVIVGGCAVAIITMVVVITAFVVAFSRRKRKKRQLAAELFRQGTSPNEYVLNNSHPNNLQHPVPNYEYIQLNAVKAGLKNLKRKATSPATNSDKCDKRYSKRSDSSSEKDGTRRNSNVYTEIEDDSYHCSVLDKPNCSILDKPRRSSSYISGIPYVPRPVEDDTGDSTQCLYELVGYRPDNGHTFQPYDIPKPTRHSFHPYDIPRNFYKLSTKDIPSPSDTGKDSCTSPEVLSVGYQDNFYDTPRSYARVPSSNDDDYATLPTMPIKQATIALYDTPRSCTSQRNSIMSSYTSPHSSQQLSLSDVPPSPFSAQNPIGLYDIPKSRRSGHDWYDVPSQTNKVIHNVGGVFSTEDSESTNSYHAYDIPKSVRDTANVRRHSDDQ